MGKIFVVGIGPGNTEHMTRKAKEVLDHSDCILGYKTYIDLIRKDYSTKKLISFPMRSEVERCNLTLQKAKDYKQVSLISSGDAGVYGMAGILLEIANEEIIEVVPGMTAIQGAAASLGAPIMHDYVSISLSDLLTSFFIECTDRSFLEKDSVINSRIASDEVFLLQPIETISVFIKSLTLFL